MKHLIRIAGVGIAACATMLGAASMVSAHAAYDHSTPGDGETVATSPANVTVYFKENIQSLPGSFGLAVKNASGVSVTSGSASVGSDKMSLSIGLKPSLAAGAYTVDWNNTSADDGDPDEGMFTFNVGAAPAGSPTAMPMDMGAPHTHTDMPMDMGAPHTHTDMPMASDEHANADAPTTGLISFALASANNSGVTGRADVFPVDGGTRTRIDVILAGFAPNSTHVGHVHKSSTCFEGAHVADLNPITVNGSGTGSASTTIDIPFSVVASGQNDIMYHTNDTMANPGKPLACGVIPAQPATSDHGAIALPNTGDGSSAGVAGAPIVALAMLAFAGAITAGAGATLRTRRQG